MTITLIAAVARNGIIGKDGAMPWHVPGEQKGFKAATMGHPMVMGRRTFETTGALPGRRSIVLTRDPAWTADGAETARSVDEALLRVGDEDFFVTGGAQIYRLFLPYADRLLLSEIPMEADGDTRFPDWPLTASDTWHETARVPHDGWQVVTWERIRPRTQVAFGDRVTRGADLKLGATAAVVRDGRLLLTRREDNGLWCLPGGGVDSGESWSEAAVREVREETGLEVDVDGVLGVYTDPDQVIVYADGRLRQIFGVCFRAHVLDGSAGCSDEVTEVRWVDAQEAARLPTVPLHRDLVTRAFTPSDSPATFV